MLPQAQTQASHPESSSSTASKRTRRHRAIQACNFCRTKKYKCDGAWPCAPCQKYKEKCVFRGADPAAGGPVYSASYVHDLERRLRIAEETIANQGNSIGTAKSSRAQGPYYGQGSSETQSPSMLTPSSRNNPSKVVQSTEIPAPGSETGSEDAEREVVDIDPVTRAAEFHGNSSSMAFLGRVRNEYSEAPQELERSSLVTAFQNATFAPKRDPIMNWNDGNDERLFSPQLYVFVETFFNTMHLISPIVDQTFFLQRCEDLWQSRVNKHPRGFLALYFAVLSLGALVRTWTEEKIGGMGRFEWSRMLFERAELALGTPGYSSDLDSIQAYFLLAKVCQHEMNLNLAYAYLGTAVRAALATGLNRNAHPSCGDPKSAEAQTASRVWWGTYSLEIETSFALGRPDTLGTDEYHNRPKPAMDGSETDILTSMVGLARIMRQTSATIYLSKATISEKLTRAFAIEADIDAWADGLPQMIRPSTRLNSQQGSLADPTWARRQRIVLQLRYHNVRMLLLRPFLIQAVKLTAQDRPLPSRMDEAIAKCCEAAASTIELIHETCRLHTFFRTWWYNTTYITFAASILLFRAAQSRLPPNPNRSKHHPPYLALIDQSLEILDAMNESLVARKTASVMRGMAARFHNVDNYEQSVPPLSGQPGETVSQTIGSRMASHDHNAQIQQLQEPLLFDPRFDAILPEAVGYQAFGLGAWDLDDPHSGFGGTWGFGSSADNFWQNG